MSKAELKVGRIMLGMCQTNCYFVYREGENKVIFIDPADQGALIHQKLQEKGFEVEAILLTHGHFDHIMGGNELRKLSGAKIYAPEADKVLLQDPYVNVSASWAKAYTLEADEYLQDGQKLTFGDKECTVLMTPGHTVGSCCYYFEEDNVLISGDTLFEGSVGRTDLPTGSMSKLNRSLKEKLMVLPDEVKVYPGHGGITTIGDEKRHNPFCC